MTSKVTKLTVVEQLEEAREIIRQLQEAAALRALPRYHGLNVTRSERAIIEALLHANGIMTWSSLNDALDAALGRTGTVNPNVLKVQIHKLRKKLRVLSPPILIGTAWGDGYYMDEIHKSRLSAISYIIDSAS